MNRIHPDLQPLLAAFAPHLSAQQRTELKRANKLGEMGMLADRIAEVTALPMTKRDLAAIIFVAIKKWDER